MLVSIFLIITFFSYAILASPNSLQVVEHLRVIPALWHLSRVVNPAHVFQVSIALQRDNHVAEILYNISTPGHMQYGQHLTREEAQSLLSPDNDSHQDVIFWLDQNNITDIKNDAHWIRFNTTVELANNLLAADFRWYRSSESHKEVLRTLKYSVPQTLHSRISLISPTTRFCSMKMMTTPQIQHHEMKRNTKSIHMEKRATVDPSCNRTITPNCLRALYNLPTNLTLSNARGVGVYASQNQVAKFKDFNLFLQNVDPSAAGSNFTFRSINGGITDQNDTEDSNEETNFDVQYSAALSFPIPNVIFSIGGQGPIQPELGNEPGDGTEPWLQWLDAILALPDDQLPHTITTSFGEDEQSFPNGYVQQVCNQFGALGARGVSFIAASGDSGPGAACVTNDGTNSTRFTAIFPGSCPYVTAVGGVKGVNPEIAVSFSAGGFSDKFAKPSYQDNSVPAYLKTLGNQFDGLFNASGRGFPDVSAQSFNLTFVTEGRVGGFAGTSAASPTWAGLIGVVNSALIAQNKAPLGFLNPWLYTTGLSAMNDITLGGSVGCTGNNPFTNQLLPAALGPKLVANAGWNATVGWDPVTGIGTPNVAKMLELAMMGNTTKRSIR